MAFLNIHYYDIYFNLECNFFFPFFLEISRINHMLSEKNLNMVQ